MHNEVRVLTSFSLTIGFKRKFQFSGGHSQIICRGFMTKTVGIGNLAQSLCFPSSKEREKRPPSFRPVIVVNPDP